MGLTLGTVPIVIQYIESTAEVAVYLSIGWVPVFTAMFVSWSVGLAHLGTRFDFCV
jgi:hypothetical protein